MEIKERYAADIAAILARQGDNDRGRFGLRRTAACSKARLFRPWNV